MKRILLSFYILLPLLIFCNIGYTQGGGKPGGGGNPGGESCSTSQPRPIIGDQNPCPGDIITYKIENDRGYTSFEWDVPRAQAGEPPVGWEIKSGQGTSIVTVIVGQKSGTMKVKVTDPVCGTKVATLPVKPGKDFSVIISGPLEVCINQNQTYTAKVTKANGHGNVQGEFIYNWTVPNGWTIVSGKDTDKLVVKPGSTEGEVSVYVIDNTAVSGNGNNGKGVGGYKKGYCGAASDAVLITIDDDCEVITPPTCPTSTVKIAGPKMVCALSENPVIYIANVTNATEELTYIWSVPEGWNITDGQGTNTLEVTPGFDPGNVTVQVINACDKTFSDNLAVSINEACSPIFGLPVELLSFTGEATKNGILLEWATASEKDNDVFEIERSTDSKSFMKIGEIQGNGTSNNKHTYNLLDTKTGKGTFYYRLKQIDFDGEFEYSKVIVVNNTTISANGTSMSVAPNPVTNGQFAIALDGIEQGVLRIVDMNGRVVYSQEISKSAHDLLLNTQRLGMKSGLYLISVQNGSQTPAYSKLVVR